MKIHCLAASTMFALIMTASEARADYGWGGQCTYGSCGHASVADAFRAGYDANVTWPRIFIPPARQAVCQTYAAMIDNGWRRQNLLGDYHFKPNSNQLTEAGKLKVKWILSQAPTHRRGIFVERGIDESQTAARVAAVYDNASNMSPSVGAVEVNDTHLVAEGHPAGAVDHTFVGFRTHQPLPVLPASTGTGSGSGQ